MPHAAPGLSGNCALKRHIFYTSQIGWGNVFSLWTILLLTDFSSMGCYQSLLYLGVGMAVIGYEAVLGVVRVQDYFKAKYTR